MSTPTERRERELCFIDVETTGAQIGYHEIVDIAVVRTPPSGEGTAREWGMRLRPRHPERLTPQAFDVSGFDPIAWANTRVSDSDVWTAFAGFVQGGIAVCHNPSFDRAFITLEAEHNNVTDLGVDYHWIGTESIAWPMYQRGDLPSISLDDLNVFLDGAPEPLPHTALAGARACRNVYVKLMHVLSSR